jgi:hypothetical protein
LTNRLHTSFVLGYHGCSRDVGEAVLAGSIKLAKSERDYDWLGPGIYFWESDPRRAWEWADAAVKRGDYREPFVLGAAIDLGHCLDMMARESLELVAAAFHGLTELVTAAGDGRKLPENKGSDGDKLMRFLDCAVIRYLHQVVEDREEGAFDSVRGLFTEGDALFPGSGFSIKTHVQIAVRSDKCIKGVFRVARPFE